MSNRNNARTLYDVYEAAFKKYGHACAATPEQWHRPDAAEFTELERLLLPHAEAGDMHCQYALATIHWLGLCCETQEEFFATQLARRERATRWWIAAAMQGYWPALDNLVSFGVGPEAKRASEEWDKLKQERPDLIGSSHGMPVYGPEFVQELSRRFYGPVIDEEG
jgi:hypothetical protein